MRKLLVVSYHFLPVHNVVVRQFVGYCNYLPEFGWDPIVLTRDWPAGELPPEDRSYGLSHVGEDALRVREIETVRAIPEEREGLVVRAQQALVARSLPSASRLTRALVTPLRKALSLAVPLVAESPDPHRRWVEPAIAAGISTVKERGVRAVLSNCPPVTNHVVGSGIATATGIPFFPYFGDLFSFDVGPFSRDPAWLRPFIRRRHQRWLRGTARTLGVAPGLIHYLRDTYGHDGDVVVVGYDERDFASPSVREPRGTFEMAHVGSLYGDQRADLLFDAMDLLLERRPELAATIRLRFVGSKQEDKLRALVRGRRVEQIAHIESKVPPAEALRLQRESDVLLLFPFRGEWNRTSYGTYSYPSKIFEYFGAERPILSMPGDADWVDALLAKTGAGQTADTPTEIAQVVEQLLARWRESGALAWNGDRAAVRAFTHRAQAERIASALDRASDTSRR